MLMLVESENAAGRITAAPAIVEVGTTWLYTCQAHAVDRDSSWSTTLYLQQLPAYAAAFEQYPYNACDRETCTSPSATSGAR